MQFEEKDFLVIQMLIVPGYLFAMVAVYKRVFELFANRQTSWLASFGACLLSTAGGAALCALVWQFKEPIGIDAGTMPVVYFGLLLTAHAYSAACHYSRWPNPITAIQYVCFLPFGLLAETFAILTSGLLAGLLAIIPCAVILAVGDSLTHGIYAIVPAFYTALGIFFWLYLSVKDSEISSASDSQRGYNENEPTFETDYPYSHPTYTQPTYTQPTYDNPIQFDQSQGGHDSSQPSYPGGLSWNEYGARQTDHTNRFN